MLPPLEARQLAQAAAEHLSEATGATYVVVLLEGGDEIVIGAWAPNPSTMIKVMLHTIDSMVSGNATIVDGRQARRRAD